MNSRQELKYNDQYTERGKFNSLTNLPDRILLQKNSKNGYLLILLGIVLLVVNLVLYLTVFNQSNGLLFGMILLAFVSIAAGIYLISQRQTLLLDCNYFEINGVRTEWTKLNRVSKDSFQAYGGVTFKNLYFEIKDNQEIEFTYNFLNYSSEDIEQLVYMFWKRGTKN